MSVPLNPGSPGIKKRAVSLDLARGTMLLLIALAHAPLYLYTNEPGLMHRVESTNIFDQIVNLLGLFIIDNRARAMFAILLGYGLVLSFESQVAKGKKVTDASKTIRRRSWFLILFGIVLAVFIGGQDVLMAYGLAGLLVSWLLARDIKALLRTFIIITVVYAIFNPILWGFIIQDNGGYGFAPEVSATDTYLSATMLKMISFPAIPVMIHVMFPILPSILAGMWLAKFQMLTKPDRHVRALYLITLAGLTISLLGALPLSLIGTVWHPDLFIAGVMHGLHMLTGIAGGLAYAAIFGLLGARLKNPGRLSRSLMALGKRSLTFFVWNEAMLVLVLSPVAFDLGGHASHGIASLIAIGIWGLSVALAALLEKQNKSGPLEILLRRLVNKPINKKLPSET